MRIENPELLATMRAAGPCEWCRKPCLVREPHHLFTKGAGRLDLRINLIALCQACHRDFHDGHILRISLLAMVANREKCMRPDIQSAIWLIRRLPKDPSAGVISWELETLTGGERAVAIKALEGAGVEWKVLA